MRSIKYILCLLLSLLVVACGNDNHQPVADAGPDQNIATGSLVTLDGSASSDVDGNPLISPGLSSQPVGSALFCPTAERYARIHSGSGWYLHHQAGRK